MSPSIVLGVVLVHLAPATVTVFDIKWPHIKADKNSLPRCVNNSLGLATTLKSNGLLPQSAITTLEHSVDVTTKFWEGPLAQDWRSQPPNRPWLGGKMCAWDLHGTVQKQGLWECVCPTL